MKYGLWQFLGVVAFICSGCNAFIHTIPIDTEKGKQTRRAESKNTENQTEKIPENVLLQSLLLRSPRYNVSVIYLKRGQSGLH